jgi:hypothetical protein
MVFTCVGCGAVHVSRNDQSDLCHNCYRDTPHPPGWLRANKAAYPPNEHADWERKYGEATAIWACLTCARQLRTIRMNLDA